MQVVSLLKKYINYAFSSLFNATRVFSQFFYLLLILIFIDNFDNFGIKYMLNCNYCCYLAFKLLEIHLIS